MTAVLTLPSESPGLNRNLVEALHLVLQDDDHVHRTGAVATAEAPHTVALNDAVERRVALGAHGSQGDRLSVQMRFFRGHSMRNRPIYTPTLSDSPHTYINYSSFVFIT